MRDLSLRWRRGTGSYWYYSNGKYDLATVSPISPRCYAYACGDTWGANIDGVRTFKLLKQAKLAVEQSFRKKLRKRKKRS